MTLSSPPTPFYRAGTRHPSRRAGSSRIRLLDRDPDWGWGRWEGDTSGRPRRALTTLLPRRGLTSECPLWRGWSPGPRGSGATRRAGEMPAGWRQDAGAADGTGATPPRARAGARGGGARGYSPPPPTRGSCPRASRSRSARFPGAPRAQIGPPGPQAPGLCQAQGPVGGLDTAPSLLFKTHLHKQGSGSEAGIHAEGHRSDSGASRWCSFPSP